jgi:hypothetical protein
LWFITAIVYWGYITQVCRTQEGSAAASYPRYAWEVNSFFLSSFMMFLFGLIAYGTLLTDVGLGFEPNFDTTGIDLTNLKWYSANFVMAITSMISFALGVNFIWVLACSFPYPLFRISDIDTAFKTGVADNGSKQWNIELTQKARQPNFWHPGASQMSQYREKLY